MLKVYYLRQLKDEANNVEYTEGSEYISQAICETTGKPNVRRVIIEESINLASLASKVEEPTQRDIANYNSLPKPAPPPRDLTAEIDGIKAKLKEAGIGEF